MTRTRNTNTQRGVWYGSQGPQRIVIGRSPRRHAAAAFSARLVFSPRERLQRKQRATRPVEREGLAGLRYAGGEYRARPDRAAGQQAPEPAAQSFSSGGRPGIHQPGSTDRSAKRRQGRAACEHALRLADNATRFSSRGGAATRACKAIKGLSLGIPTAPGPRETFNHSITGVRTPGDAIRPCTGGRVRDGADTAASSRELTVIVHA